MGRDREIAHANDIHSDQNLDVGSHISLGNADMIESRLVGKL
jgi:hypothetical protein